MKAPRPSQLFLRLAYAMGVAACASSAAWSLPNSSPQATNESSGPYCGIYSLYAALRMQGIQVSFDQLAQGKYVGSPMGSSLRELKQAAEDCGACAQPLEGMSPTTLRAARFPVLLHWRRPGRRRPYL